MKKEQHRNEIQRFKRTIRNNERRLSRLPEGRVSIRKRRNTYSLEVRTGGKKSGSDISGQYVSLLSPEASLFATKLYLEKTNELMRKKLEALIEFDNNYDYADPEKVILDFPPQIRNLIKDPILSREDRVQAWVNETYASNPMPFDSRFNYTTAKGLRVRSRAELAIANLLTELGIPFRYEAPFWDGDKTVYPDFTIMNPFTEEIFYLEYFGAMHDREYAVKQYRKINRYALTEEAANFFYIFEFADYVSMDLDAIKNLILKKVFGNRTEEPDLNIKTYS